MRNICFLMNEGGLMKMSEITKLKCAMIVELFVCIIMLISFLYETRTLFKFFSLFLALMSVCFAFDKRRDLKELME